MSGLASGAFFMKPKESRARVFFAKWLFHRTGFTPDQPEYQNTILKFLSGKLLVLKINEERKRAEMFVLEEEEQ